MHGVSTSALQAALAGTLCSGTFRNPQPLVFSQKHRRYKWEAYCGTNGTCIVAFTFLQSLEASKAQCYKWGRVLRYKLEVYCSTFLTGCTGWGLLKIAHAQSDRLRAMVTPTPKIRLRLSPFSARPFYLFPPSPSVPHPSPGNLLPQNPLFLGPQNNYFFSGGTPAQAGCLGEV